MSAAARSIMDAAGATARERPPVRIVHLGLGAFHRAHQAWYTAHAADADRWGIAAFAGRSSELADALSAQDGLYTLVERAADADRYEIVGSIVRAYPGHAAASLVRAIAHPHTALVTLSITESGYASGTDEHSPIRSLVDGLAARRPSGGNPIAVVSCDNIPANGATTRAAVLAAADRDPALAGWIADAVSFVSTSVDRITPRITPEDIRAVERLTGWRDAAPVITEPFTDWVLSGQFPAGRPQWESAGARFVADVEPWERRKLWLLNGAHTVLAALGTLRGHATVADAIADTACATAVEGFWDEASRHLPDLQLASYRRALRERFANPRMQHRLEQIAQDALTKARLRLAPIVFAERRAGRPATASVRGIAAVISSAGAGSAASVLERLATIHPDLASDPVVREAVAADIAALTRHREVSA